MQAGFKLGPFGIREMMGIGGRLEVPFGVKAGRKAFEGESCLRPLNLVPVLAFVVALALGMVAPGVILAQGVSPALDLPAMMPGSLSLRGVPVGVEDWDFAPFSDQGAWFGFSVPEADRPETRGGFAGPFLMPEGRWISSQLASLEVKESGSDEPIPWDPARTPRADAHPGSLRREWRVQGLAIKQRLWFDSCSTAILSTSIRNTDDMTRDLDLAWSGSVFSGVVLEESGNGVRARSPEGAVVRVTPGGDVSGTEVVGQEFRITLEGPFSLAPGDSVSVALAMTHAISGEEIIEVTGGLHDPAASWQKNLERWNRYLAAVDTGRPADHPDQIVAVKSLMTLVNNWRAPAGRMRFSALFPSSNVWYFNGFWAWDSWKHAVGLLVFAPELAKDQVRAMFDHQDDRGMIADVVYLDASEDNWRNTKPPLAGWAIQTIFEQTGDLDFVRELYQPLVTYHRFWYTHRDHERDGLCEYGSTDGTIIAARWESGMDNAVRFDDTGMLPNGPGAWSMDQESVDLNAYLYREKQALAFLAQLLGHQEEAESWAEEAGLLRDRIRKDMYDEATGWFYDIGIDSGSFIRVQGPEGWIPLWAGLATEEQAARARDIMLDPQKFNTHVPFPTVAADHPEYSDGYWRGLVWLDQAYFAIEGLRNYGYGKEADELVNRLMRNLEGAAIPGAPLRENYYPVTGAGQNVRHFSWTAAHLLMLTRPAAVRD